MAIMIDLKMPKSCADCKFGCVTINNNRRCKVNDNCYSVICTEQERPGDCPLKDAPKELEQLKQLIKSMPSVQPKPKTGNWIWCVGSHQCSNCKEYTCFSHKKLLRYCPNCGARMVEPQESEEKKYE